MRDFPTMKTFFTPSLSSPEALREGGKGQKFGLKTQESYPRSVSASAIRPPFLSLFRFSAPLAPFKWKCVVEARIYTLKEGDGARVAVEAPFSHS